jgi:adenylosuccinate lyase
MIERYSRAHMKQIWDEKSKFDKWLKVEIAACEAWTELGEIPQDAMIKIRNARCDITRLAEILDITHHDMTAFLGSVAESLGEESRFIHLGLTSSDIMDTALGLQLKESSEIIEHGLAELIAVLEHKAVKYKYTLMIGRTHGVHAEPITFGLKIARWVEEMKRNAQRLLAAKEAISIGKISGAVGTYATVPPDIERIACSKLGLSPDSISSQIIQRDRHAQFMSTLAILGGSLENIATEIRSLQRTEILELEEPFQKGQTGSSAMPHKRNPELCERICGIARLLRGYAITSLENIALWHERDISHSSTERVILPDACLLIDYALSLLIPVMKNLNVYPENMRRNLELTRGLVFSQKVLLGLIDTGLSREEAYKIVQVNAMKVWQDGEDFLTLLKNDNQVNERLDASKIESLFDYNVYIKYVDTVFQRLGLVELKDMPTQQVI